FNNGGGEGECFGRAEEPRGECLPERCDDRRRTGFGVREVPLRLGSSEHRDNLGVRELACFDLSHLVSLVRVLVVLGADNVVASDAALQADEDAHRSFPELVRTPVTMRGTTR